MNKRAEATNTKFFNAFGFNENGFTWIANGNTFEVKDELKGKGARFNSSLGWHFDHPEDNTTRIHVSDVAIQRANGTWWLNYDLSKAILDKCRLIGVEPSKSQYVGEVGQQYTGSLTYKTHFGYDSVYGTMFIYKFEDDNENIFVWSTSKYIDDIKEGDLVTITGRIKRHSEFRGEQQTALTRCKLSVI